FREGDKDLHVTVYVRDPHGEWDEANLTIKVDIPEEPGPSYTVSALAPWVLVALVAALAAGIILSQRERRRREGEEGV
ncbi:MAG: hypothetical protein GWN18_14455, partial [Thermoplasmata archaeon]|nr:hypothetical protein [Thermoplasmata archaeon]NIS13252.1 hypothetical protein [Thermoplasmata archaeon]NIS21147.1 hypothetical protein [Thermoplasmata archaeon]NIT78634.1 hypothetical protein [Thermoplasmata archaeon]NIU50202.1 hypothetical protein [Thermoplasmata archaeon]